MIEKEIKKISRRVIRKNLWLWNRYKTKGGPLSRIADNLNFISVAVLFFIVEHSIFQTGFSGQCRY